VENLMKKNKAPGNGDMSWTRRAERDTHCNVKRRWVMGPQLRQQGDLLVDDPSAKKFDEFRGEDKFSQDIQKVMKASDHWLSQIANIVAAARQSSDDDAFDAERLTLSLLRNSKSCVSLGSVQADDAAKSSWDAIQQHNQSRKRTGDIPALPLDATTSKSSTIGKSVSLPHLTIRTAVTSMYRPRGGKEGEKVRASQAQLPPVFLPKEEPARLERGQAVFNNSPTKRYVKVCQKFGVLPTPMPCITGQSTKLDATDRALTDEDLLAFTAVIRSMSRLEEVILDGNTLLSEKALVVFFRKLFGPPASCSMQRLSIKRCHHAARMPMEIIVELIGSEQGLQNLQHLDLSGVQIAMKHHLPLATAISEHSYINSVCLSDTGLGSSPFVRQCVVQLLSSTTLQALDLSWNPFSAEIFAQLGEVLAQSQCLKSLSLSNCSAASRDPAAAPILYFIEHLHNDKSLEFLDITLNQIDYHGALALEDALEMHKLQRIDISQNPFGILGMRSMFRLLSRETSGLTKITCESCFAFTPPDPKAVIFSMSMPNGKYKLDLSQPYYRSVLRMLYKTSERLQISPEKAIVLESHSLPYTHPPSKEKEVWLIPEEGRLRVNFRTLRGMDVVEKHGKDRMWKPHIDALLNKLKLQPGASKLAPLLAIWRSFEGRMREQYAMLKAMSRDFLFSYPQMEQICDSRLFASKAIGMLFHCILGGPGEQYLCYRLSPSLGEQVGIRRRVSKLLDMNIETPTGRYILNLAKPVDLAIAERLFLLDRWEIRRQELRENIVDTSQKGNMSQIRNARYQKQPLFMNRPSDWNLAEVGEFSFDYVTTRRPRKDAAVLAGETFSALLSALLRSECPSADWVKTLSRVASQMWLTSALVRQLMVNIPDKDSIDEIVVLFYFRVVDVWNAKMFMCRSQDMNSLFSRLGHVNVFPFYQPEHYLFEWDFARYEERLAANLFIKLTNLENPGGHGHLRDTVFWHADGTKDLLEYGVPRLWYNLEGMPQAGVFKTRYVCAPEDVKFHERRALCQKYGKQQAEVDSTEVSWWAALDEAPSDVVTYLAAIVAQYTDVRAAFIAIDGMDGDDIITLRDLEESLQSLHSALFHGPDQKSKAVTIFRHLDQSGEGQLSLTEFSVLEKLWKEVHLSIIEYTRCVARPFRGDLREAWKAIDADGSGDLDQDEWCEAARKFNYHGPAKTVFQFLDKDGCGVVTLEKFLALKNTQISSYHRRGGMHRDSTDHAGLLEQIAQLQRLEAEKAGRRKASRASQASYLDEAQAASAKAKPKRRG
jgi:Ca2+-binding EF-hand superfamily protein